VRLEWGTFQLGKHRSDLGRHIKIACLPLDKPGPRRRGICLIKASDARKASYFFASFLTSFLFLLSLCEMTSQVNNYSRKQSQPDVLFQIVNGHVLKANSLGTVNIVGISENAERHARPRDIRKSINRNMSTQSFPSIFELKHT